MAFTDLDGDRYTDYVAVESRNSSQLLFYVWDEHKQQFLLYKRRLPTMGASSPLQIEQIIIYDLNQNGENEFIITAKDHKSLYKTQIFTTNCIQCENDLSMLPNSEINSMGTVPFLIDNQGNGRVRLVTVNSTGRYIYSYDFITNNFDIKPFNSILNTNNTMFNPIEKHFASIIDLNNDCYADLTILSYKEINQQKIYQL